MKDCELAALTGIILLVFLIFSLGVLWYNTDMEERVTTGKTIVIDQSTYQCKVVNALKEEK